MKEEEVLYYECQSYKPVGPWTTIVPSSLFLIVYPAYSLYKLISESVNINDDSVSADTMMLIGPLMIAVGMAMLWMYYAARLETIVTNEAVYYRFYPFNMDYNIKTPEQIKSFEMVKYNPLIDYGGWGIRYNEKGKAFNVSGDKGVQFTLSDRALLIGTQNPEKFMEALQSMDQYS